MSARTKLNSHFALGAFVVAAVIGLVVQSWVAFFGALVVLMGVFWWTGDIRTHGGTRRL